MANQRVGMCFLDRPDPRRQVALSTRMEELGYESVWVCETRTARDAISVMGAISYATSRIKIGSGVVNSWTRPASLMSLTFATLDELAPDRMLLGIGAYWDPLAWKQGIDRRRPVKQMREYIEVTRRLLALETVTFEGELVAVRDLRLDLGHGVARTPKRVPIYVGATGPQMLALSGELADGVMLNGFTSLTYLDDALRHIERGACRSGRGVEDLDLPQTIVVSMDEDEEKALDVATRMTTMYLGQQPHIARASGVDQDLLDRVREAMGGWPPREGGIAAAMPLVAADVVRSLTAAGTPEQCLEQVAAYSIRPNIYPALLPITENYEEIIEVFAPPRHPGS
ncbi:MAG: LLM class flavin-dependent oxidoreductase [bacterium]|nr:LLM class flavin-dependent oxidoreductase [bacterium]MDE0289363.1 LLM class flavin-dependent oxidoreductase [bacterium]MDE0439435.1 LLM class flavin-dependent oxidoreductase [bacterium]